MHLLRFLALFLLSFSLPQATAQPTQEPTFHITPVRPVAESYGPDMRVSPTSPVLPAQSAPPRPERSHRATLNRFTWMWR